MNANTVRYRILISDDFTRSAAKHIKKGDLKAYSTDDTYIYKVIMESDHVNTLLENKALMMTELGLEAELDFNYKGE